MPQLVRPDLRAKTFADLLKVNHDRILKGAPRRDLGLRLLSIAFNAVAYNTDLLQCSKESIIGGVFESVKLGLTIGGPMQEAWLIPFNTKTGKVAQLIVGYQGYRTLIDRARTVMDLHPRAVHVDEADPNKAGEFRYQYGDDPRIFHVPCGKPVLSEADLFAAYAVARLRGGGKQMEVMLKEELDDHRRHSRAKDSGAWVTYYVPMCLKTVLRKIVKYLPKSTEELARAMAFDDAADQGVDQTFELDGFVIPSDDPAAVAPGARLDALKETLGVSSPAGADVAADEIRWTPGDAARHEHDAT